MTPNGISDAKRRQANQIDAKGGVDDAKGGVFDAK